MVFEHGCDCFTALLTSSVHVQEIVSLKEFAASSYQRIVNEAISIAGIIFARSVGNGIYFTALHVGKNAGVVLLAHAALEEKRDSLDGNEYSGIGHCTLVPLMYVAAVSMELSSLDVGTNVSHFRGPAEVPVQVVNLQTKTSLSRKFRPMIVTVSLACCSPYSGQTRNTSTVSFIQNESEPDSFIGMIFSKTCAKYANQVNAIFVVVAQFHLIPCSLVLCGISLGAQANAGHTRSTT